MEKSQNINSLNDQLKENLKTRYSYNVYMEGMLTEEAFKDACKLCACAASIIVASSLNGFVDPRVASLIKAVVGLVGASNGIFILKHMIETIIKKENCIKTIADLDDCETLNRMLNDYVINPSEDNNDDALSL